MNFREIHVVKCAVEYVIYLIALDKMLDNSRQVEIR